MPTFTEALKLKINLVDKKYLWFLIMGGLNTVVGFSLFPLVYWLLVAYRSHYLILLTMCHGIAVCISYLTNKFLVFRSNGYHSKEFLKFISFHGMSYLLMIVLMPFLVERVHLNPIVIQLSLTTVIVCISFFWYDKVVFLTKKY